MTDVEVLCPADLLVELHCLGVQAAIVGDGLSLRPASRIPQALLEAARAAKPDLMGLLTDPRRRWRVQAEALVGAVTDDDLRHDLLETFDEREAIASVDGGLDDEAAGRLAYEVVLQELAARKG